MVPVVSVTFVCAVTTAARAAGLAAVWSFRVFTNAALSAWSAVSSRARAVVAAFIAASLKDRQIDRFFVSS